MYGIGALASEFLIGDSTVCNMTHHTEKPSQVRDKRIFLGAIVEAKYLLINIEKQMEGFDADVCALESALEQAPEVFESVGVDLAVNVLLRMVDYLMCEILIVQSLIGHKRIGINRAVRLYVFANLTLKLIFAIGRQNNSANVSATLQHAERDNLIALSALANFVPVALVAVHVASLAADESFVYFYFLPVSAEFDEIFVVHRKTNPLEHEPRRLLRNAEGTRYFVRANPVLAVGKHPDSNHPLIHAEGRILEDRAYLDRELLLATLAKPKLAGRDERVLFGLAARADNLAVVPAEQYRVPEGPLRVGEERDGFLQGIGKSECLVHGLPPKEILS
jgi:hypothetical protein